MASENIMEKGIPHCSSGKTKGGFITLPFIIVQQTRRYALVPTMMFYLKRNYHMTIAAGQTLINSWQAFTNFAPILCAFFADSYMGRFVTIGLGSVASFLGVGMLWLTTLLPQTRPPPCDSITYTTCESATPGQKWIMMAIAGTQHLFPVLQTSTMDRHIVGGFEIPAASLIVVVYLTGMVWVVLYERAIIPLVSKIKGKQVYLSVYLRMGLGLFFSVIAMGLTAMVESVRLHKVNQEYHIKYPTAMVNMSAMWLLPQYIVMGIAEALSALGQFEFYHRAFP
ncbi:hypothetical protein V6N13_084077 [Hibiscus sabdariffa]|uniref:Uncharacterized protein n=1 Tax=Hibiscus sabdariffa TaxID=183260 RepID=A0ABR2T0Q7_9ROSI